MQPATVLLASSGMTSAVPWWLGGEETCPHCFRGYAYEVEIRCTECDEPGCPLCFATVRAGRAEPICLRCHREAGEE